LGCASGQQAAAASLGVEEQFYFVFPALLLLIWRYRAMTWSFVLIGIASFALNIAVVRDHASFTFFLPLTRFWEFIAGALFACSDLPNRQAVLPLLSALSARRWREWSAATGMLLIIAGISFASEASFPGWWALLPVFGSFFIIGAGPQAWLNRHVLSKPGLVLIGLISGSRHGAISSRNGSRCSGPRSADRSFPALGPISSDGQSSVRRTPIASNSYPGAIRPLGRNRFAAAWRCSAYTYRPGLHGTPPCAQSC